METTGERDEGRDRPAFAECAEFDAFSRLHWRRLVHWYRRCGLSAEDAADVAQETLAGLARRWPQLRTEEHRRRSYYAISKNRLAEHRRSQHRRIKPDVSLDDAAAADIIADQCRTDPGVILGGTANPVWTAVEELPEARRHAVVGRVVHSMSYDELAAVTGRTTTAVRQDVSRGLAWLRHALKALPCLLGAAVVKSRGGTSSARATLSSAASTALAVVPQTALLTLLLTTPLYVLPARSALTGTLTDVHGLVVAAPLSRPVRDRVVALVGPASVARRLARASRPTQRMVHRHRRRQLAEVVAPPVQPPDVCLKNRCGTGERITVTVLGQEQSVPQNYVPLCWAVPEETTPHVTCSEGSDPK